MPVPLDQNMIHPAIEPCLQVLASGNVGLFGGRLKIEEISSSNFSTVRNAGNERLKLTIPYAGQSIQWIVNFDARNPEIPPEFSFPDEDFLVGKDAAILEEHLPTMMNWNKNDPRGMLNMIQELLVLYRNYQINVLVAESSGNESRGNAKFWLTALLESRLVSEEDLEVLVGPHDHDPVNILVRLAVELSNLPESVLPAGSVNPGDDVAALLISYPSTGRCTAQLFLSPKIDEILGGNKNIQIPSFTKYESLPNYVAVVKKLIEEKINSISSNYRKRRGYLETLLNQMGRAALEFDALNFSKVSFLMEWNNFCFIVHAHLPTNFPEERPVYMFQSVYHSINNKPFTAKCTDFPYSPRWDSIEMADRAKAFILSYVDTFQRNSVRSGQQQ